MFTTDTVHVVGLLSQTFSRIPRSKVVILDAGSGLSTSSNFSVSDSPRFTFAFLRNNENVGYDKDGGVRNSPSRTKSRKLS